MIAPVQIGSRKVGNGFPCFIVAEAGVNHNGEMDKAHQLIDAAVSAGADAVKFQAFMTEDLVSAAADKADYQKTTTGAAGGQYEMLKKLELGFEQQAELKRHCDDSGIIYLCTPYENKSADMLEKMSVSAIKIASTDTNNIPFLRYLAPKGLPVVLSTGMSTLGEIEEAVETLKHHGLENKIILLQCTSEYPAPFQDVNLRAIKTLEAAFHCPVGFSDHTPGTGAGPWSVAVGACMVEKHFTLDCSLEGPDHRASVEPKELKVLVESIRNVEAALGDGLKRIAGSELPNKVRMQKSLVVARAIKAGKRVSAQDIVCKRPGTGLSPSWLDRVVGKKIAKDHEAGQVLALDSIQWQES